MQEIPLITIIVPIYNVEPYIEECLTSIRNQSYQKLEVILVENLSTDQGRKIAERICEEDLRFQLFDCMTKGLAAARNFGLSKATGEFIFFVDSDDCITENSVEILLQTAKEQDADLVMGGYYRCGDGSIHEGNATLPSDAILMNRTKIQEYFLSEGRNFNFMWGKLYRREVLEGIIFPEGKLYEDLQTYPKILEKIRRAVIIQNPIYFYRQRPTSITYGSTVEQQLDGLYGRLSNVTFYEEHYPSLVPAANSAALEFAFFLLGRAYRLGREEHKEAWETICEKIREIEKKELHLSKAENLGLALFHISPALAGMAFALYSRKKNKV